jgi:hypothetical protein
VKPLRVFLAVSFVPLGAGVLPQAPARSNAVPRFERLSDTGAGGSVLFGFDARGRASLAERHARGQPFRLPGLPLPGGGTAELELRPVSALEPGARAQVVHPDGGVTLIEPRARCFAGRVVGGGTAFLGLTERGMDGFLHADGELLFLSSGEAAPGRARLTRSSRLGEHDEGLCGVVERALFSDGSDGSDGSGDGDDGRESDAIASGILRAVSAPTLRTADVFIEADNDFRARFTSNQECADYSALLITAASEIYRRDIGTRLRIPDGYLRIWNTTPPWGPVTGFRSLDNVYSWWQSTQNPLKDIPRAAVHVFTSPVFGGTSRGIDGLCRNNRAYEISSLTGSFPYPIKHSDRYNWDLFVVCHEFGHTFGSPHSNLYLPPIQCVDGSGPDSGTIMSYCHTTYGMARVGLRFHLREQQKIRTASADNTCLPTQLLLPGDYDGDGAVDPGDHAALREVMAQGFRSTAAEEVFDLNHDGVLNDVDHDLVAELAYEAPPAQLLPRNGSGINPPCLEALGNPVLGQLWRARIYAPGAGSSTLLVGYDQPLDGLSTTRGELLVKTSPFGGTKLFSNVALSNGTFALHELALPLEPALYGLPVSFQALIVDGPSGDQYCNALDVILSPYE